MSKATTAAGRWRAALDAWAIPDEILARAPESPWGFPPAVFGHATSEALSGRRTPTHNHAADGLAPGGSVLDIGAGTGAASLPLLPPARLLVAVDESAAMLDELRTLAPADADVDVVTVHGRWPDVADEVDAADVVVCANVLYNVADLRPFLEALHRHARARVVVELTAEHPQCPLGPLWRYFWGLDRPDGPTAEDAVTVIEETLGVRVASERWSRPVVDHGTETIPWLRRRLCLTADKDEELAELVAARGSVAPRQMVTCWW